jgi:hypothetical protein
MKAELVAYFKACGVSTRKYRELFNSILSHMEMMNCSAEKACMAFYYEFLNAMAGE